PELGDDQPLEEDLHLEDLLLERVGVERHARELVEIRVALGRAADHRDQLQPRLRVARLVLHERRVVELRLVVRREREELRRHLDRELVGLQLLGDHRAPDVAAPRLLLRRALRLGDRRQVVPGQVAPVPLGALRKRVVPVDLAELLARRAVLDRRVQRLPPLPSLRPPFAAVSLRARRRASGFHSIRLVLRRTNHLPSLTTTQPVTALRRLNTPMRPTLTPLTWESPPRLRRRGGLQGGGPDPPAGGPSPP